MSNDIVAMDSKRVALQLLSCWLCYKPATKAVEYAGGLAVGLCGEHEDSPPALTVEPTSGCDAAVTYECHCCGAYFQSAKPADPERDVGFGTCEKCHPMVAASWAKHGFPGVSDLESARARLRRFA
jgi:hypothetical protein